MYLSSISSKDFLILKYSDEIDQLAVYSSLLILLRTFFLKTLSFDETQLHIHQFDYCFIVF